MNLCPNCQTTLESDAEFCQRCGFVPTTAGAPLPISTVSYKGAPTQQLIHTALFSRLADGSLLYQDRYEILACLEQRPDFNTYLVQDCTRSRCTNCDRVYASDSYNFCEECGQKLQPLYFLLLESFSELPLARAIVATQHQVFHAGLVNFYDRFVDSPVQQRVRFYVVKDPVWTEASHPSLTPAQSVAERPPSDCVQALFWCREIVHVLDTLLQAGVYLPSLASTQLLYAEGRIRLEILEDVQLLSAEATNMAAVCHMRVIAELLQIFAHSVSFSPAQQKILAEAHQSSAPYPTATDLLAALEKLQLQPGPPAGRLFVVTGMLTDLGLVRTTNEDSVLRLEFDQNSHSARLLLRLYAIADGMGGHAAGEVASRLALSHLASAVIEQALKTLSVSGVQMDLADLLKQAVQRAAGAVYAETERTRSDMGTTLVAVLVDLDAGNAYVANVGDSRLYRITQQEIRQVSKDHSLVQLLIDKKQLTPAQARHHPQAHQIYRTLGERAQVEIDLFVEMLQPDDILLLCSDGLSGLVEDSQMAAVIAHATTPQAACQQLVDLARLAGGHDNISAIIVQLKAA